VVSARTSVLLSLALALPMAMLVSVIVFELRPLEAVLKSVLTDDGARPNPAGFVFMGGGLLALPVALAISLWPVVQHRNLRLLNLVIAALIVWLMIPTWGGVLQDVYRCDILRIPHCD
jgi:hypothetical protein